MTDIIMSISILCVCFVCYRAGYVKGKNDESDKHYRGVHYD